MRVSTSMIFDSGTTTMQKRIADVLKLQQQLSTNRRMLTPSDDPVASAQALEVTQANNINKLYMANQDAAGDALAMGEAQLGAAGTLLQSVYERIVQLGDAALTDADRKNITTELRENFKQLMGMANEKDGLGNYLFSGYSGDTQPFTGDIENGVTYVGDAGHRELQVSPSRSLQVGESGLDLFMRVPNASVPFQASAASGNTGTGSVYAPTVTGPAQWSASSNTQIYNITFTAANTYSITDYQGAAITGFTGLTYAPSDIALPDATTLSLSNTPVLGGSYSSTNYNVVFDDPSSGPAGSYSYSVYDKQGNAVAGYQSLTYTPSKIALPNGGQVTMSGTPAAGDTFNTSPAGNTDVFSVLSTIVTEAEKGYQYADAGTRAKFDEQLGFALSNIQSAMDNLLKYRGNYGSRMQEAADLTSAGEDRGLQYKTTLSRLQDVDVVQASSDLVRTQTALQAAQLTFSQISKLSLFNYL